MSVPSSVIHRVYLDDPALRPQTRAHHVARYEFAASRLRGDLVLDMMCGSGYGAEILRSAGARVVGIDADEDAIEHAQGNYSRNAYFSTRAEDVRLPPSFFSGIVWFEGIEHIMKGDGEELLVQCANALLPGGTLFVSTPRDANEKYNPWHLSRWALGDLLEATCPLFAAVDLYGQDWDTAAITRDDVAANDFYILVCRK